MKPFKNVINASYTMTVNLSRIAVFQVRRNVTEDHLSVFFAAKRGKIVKRVDKSVLNGIF
jgi:hypothetical protein